MGVGDQHHADRRRSDPLVDRREVNLIVRAGVDHGDDRPRLDDPGVRAGPGVWTRVWRDYAVD
jgi:hypothetical protein